MKEAVKMKKITCDYCNQDIPEEYYMICIYKYDEEQTIKDEEECEFCSERCMGKWMVEKAKESYGVYE